jgi:hypothetical protein
MAKPPKIYPPEFRQKIMELIRSGESGNAVARRFNVSTRDHLVHHFKPQMVRNTGVPMKCKLCGHYYQRL